MSNYDTDSSTGLLGHFIGTIDNSWGGTKADYMDGVPTLLQWEITVDDVLQEDYDNVPPPSVSNIVTLGDGWDVNDAGLFVHEDDESRSRAGKGLKRFKSNSQIGRIIDVITGKQKNYGANAVVLDGDGDIDSSDFNFDGLIDYWDKNFPEGLRDPKIWQGVTFEFRGIGFAYPARAGEMPREPRQKPLPIRVVKLPDGSGPASTASTGGEYDFTQHGADDNLNDRLNDILKRSKSHSGFVKEAMKLADVDENLTDVLTSDEVWAARK